MDGILKIKTADRLSSVGEYYFSTKLRQIAELKAGGRDIISLGIGSPDRMPDTTVIERLNSEAHKPDAHGYQPYTGLPSLREAFAKWYGTYYGVEIGAGNVLPLIGSKEGLMHIAMTYVQNGDKVLIPNPGYPTYRSAFTLAGAECVDYKLTAAGSWQPDLDAIEAAGLEGVKLMVVNYPNMPTGAMPDETLFERLIAFGRKHNILIVNDNPYSFIRTKRRVSLLAVKGALDVAIELNSLSKSHNMAGWRIGAIIAHPERLGEIIRFKSNMDSGMFKPMQAAAVEALSLGEEWYASLNRIYAEREEIGYRIMDALGCHAEKGQAGLFIWGRIPEGAGDCFEFIDRVLDKNDIFITPGGIFGSEGNNYVRISLCADSKTLTEALNRIKEGRR